MRYNVYCEQTELIGACCCCALLLQLTLPVCTKLVAHLRRLYSQQRHAVMTAAAPAASPAAGSPTHHTRVRSCCCRALLLLWVRCRCGELFCGYIWHL